MKEDAHIAPYGSWKSPITSDLIITGSIGLGQIAVDGNDTYWIELRPTEGGRSVIVRRTPDGDIADVTPQGFNSRTRVHEYGGGDFVVSEGVVYFSNFADQRFYRQPINASGATPQPLTPAVEMRYADPFVDTLRRRIIAVREDHTEKEREAVNTLVSLDIEGANEKGGRVLVSGNDFYSSPRLSPDGKRLAWLTWNHPNMPWDGCELWVGELAADGSIASSLCVAGGLEESIFQPQWSPDGALYFVSDRSGWWNLYRAADDGRAVVPVCEMAAEFGTPQWVFGMSMYAFESKDRIVCAYIENGQARLATIDTATGKLAPLDTPYTDITYICAAAHRVAFRAGSPTSFAAVVQFDSGAKRLDVLRRVSDLTIDAGYLSIPQAIEFPTEGNLKAHGFYYAPRNKDYAAPEEEKPPLLVRSHGGPTAATSTTLALGIQYWTSRGFAVLDVNYGGSSNYGRAYRQRLNKQWGVVDVDDCVNGARYLIERGLADANRCAIDGGSAGGYTTLCALTFRDLFKAGASHFGLSDLEVFVGDTHKFESRYLEGLVGKYPEERELYRARSPINFTDKLSCPVIFFQGLEDKVVPPNQAELMVDALRAKKMPVAYVAYEGEQHGFRRAENIKRTLDGEFYFYSKIFNFEMADDVEPITIENL
ncbi:MAG: prolyl oligopeptidase family serine peptidase [Pyrinomonadaceae bacterium]